MTRSENVSRSSLRTTLQRVVLTTAVIGTLLTICVVGYVTLRMQGVVTDATQYGSPFSSGTWETIGNCLAVTGCAVELRWRFQRMPARWNRCVAAGIAPEGEVTYPMEWSQFWYRQGYLDAITVAMTSVMCGMTSFTTPTHCDAAGAYFQGAVNGERVV